MSCIKLCFLLTIVPVLTFAQNNFVSDDENKFYSSRYDNIDVEVIFRSSRLLNNYVDCLLDKKPCPPEGKDLKRVLPHALRTRCARCTKIQKAKALDVITRLYYQHPSIYLALADRYDPTGEYTKNFENWFDEEQRDKVNELPQKFSRIPSTWITSPSTTTFTTTTTTTSRPTLRTRPSTVRIKVVTTDRPTPRPAANYNAQQNGIFSQFATQRPPSTIAVIPLRRFEQQQPAIQQQQQTFQDFNPRPAIREQNLSPPPSSSFRPFQQQQSSAEQSVNQNTSPIVNTFRISTERTFQTPARAVPAITAASRTFPVSSTALPSSSSSAAATTRPLLPSVSTPTTRSSTARAASITTATSRPSVLPASNAADSSRHPSPARGSASSTLLPTVQFTQRPPLSDPPLPPVAISTISVSTNSVQSLPTADINRPLLPATATAPLFNFIPPQQQQPAVTFRTPLIQRPSLSINDPNLIDNFFVPRNGPIRRSINQLLDTTGQVVNNAVRTFFNG